MTIHGYREHGLATGAVYEIQEESTWLHRTQTGNRSSLLNTGGEYMATKDTD